MESVTLTQSEQARLQLLNSLLAEQTAILMGVCRRHTRRILAAYRQNGATALVFAPRVGAGPSSSGATQFTRAMDELGVELILPRSLHAKGRVESKPESTDGRREDSRRGVRELQARWPGLHWGRWEGVGRSSVAAQGPYGRLRGLRCAGW